ncbi:MAG: histidine kinase [Verrucomicrobiaceae bacterium]|nr:histidine kinase [Verrucomicrobiaceae bacterium]
MPVQQDQRAADKSSFFIPDLCSVQSVFLLVLVAELLAIVLTVNRHGLQQFTWQNFATLSLFVQWTVLLSAAGLCQLRLRLAYWPRASAAAVSYLWVLLVTAAVSALAQWLIGGLAQGADWHIDYWQLLDNLLISAVLAGIALRYFYLAQELRQRQRAELEARVQALQSRIRPHFLFNSMNSIASLIGSDPAAAEAAVEDLATLFRATLSQVSTEVSMAEEVELCRRYLNIEQLRLGERLQVDWHIDGLPDALPIPGLCLQPLLENAIYHGIQTRPQGGCIRVDGEYADGWVRLAVTNPLPDVTALGHKGNHMALDNIARRLQALYGEDAGVSSEHEQQNYVARLFYRASLAQASIDEHSAAGNRHTATDVKIPL